MGGQDWSRLLEIQRNGISERVIFGAIAVANDHGVLHRMDADPQIYGRSLMKPFQMKVVASELADKLDWEEKALSLASHNGTAMHTQIAEQMLATEKQKFLALPASYPMTGPLPGIPKSVWMNPCSGKHSAILLACESNRWPMSDYIEVKHPYNVKFRQMMESVIGVNLETRKVAADGCLLPTWAMHVSEMAVAFASLAQTRNEDWIWEAFHRYPQLIGGDNRLDSQIVALHPDVLAKEGADGLLGLSISNEKYPSGLGVVIKLAHGYDAYVMSVLAHQVLNEFGFEITKPPAPAGQDIVFSRAITNLTSLSS